MRKNFKAYQKDPLFAQDGQPFPQDFEIESSFDALQSESGVSCCLCG
jgi:hypothetical protein